jgi:uncharacterized protein YneF (UPF0154 family)
MAKKFNPIIVILVIMYVLLIGFIIGLFHFVSKVIPGSVLFLLFLALLSIPYFVMVGIGKGATYSPSSKILNDYLKKDPDSTEGDKLGTKK